MSNELDMLLASAPPRDAADFAGFEARFLNRQPGCLSTGDIIRLSLGQADPRMAEDGQSHLKTCDTCRAIHDAYKLGLDEEESLPAGGSLLDEFSAKGERMTDLVPVPSPAPPLAGPSHASGSQSISLTNIGALLLGGRWEEALALLRPCLPEFLEAVGLDPLQSEGFFQFLHERLASGRGLPSSGLPGWLEDFARTELALRALPRRLAPLEWETIRHRCALLTLRESSGEPAATRDFLTRALNQGVRSCEQLDLIRLRDPSAQSRISDVECRDLIKRGRKQSKRFAPLFPTRTY
jgi:hypothetical protein